MATSNQRAPQLFVSVKRQGVAGKPTKLEDATTRVLSMVFDESDTTADKLKLTIDNRTLENFETKLFADGNVLIFRWGYPGNMAPERTATIVKVTGSIVLAVEAHGKEAIMNREQKTRSWTNVRRSEVAIIIAREQGFGDDVLEVDETPVALPIVSQARMTDANLLRTLAQKEGFEWYIDDTGFHFHSRRLGQRPRKLYTYFMSPGADVVNSFESWNLETDITAKPGAVQHVGVDPLTKKPIDATGDHKSTTGRPGIAQVQKVIDPKTGAAHKQLANASGVKVASTAKSQADAQAQANGAFARSQTNAVKLTFEAPGDPLICAKSLIRIEGIGSVLSGNYYISACTHKVAPGYKISVHCRRDGTNAGGTGIASTAKTNDQKAPDDPNAPQKRKVVDPKTGEEHTEYHKPGKGKAPTQ